MIDLIKLLVDTENGRADGIQKQLLLKCFFTQKIEEENIQKIISNNLNPQASRFCINLLSKFENSNKFPTPVHLFYP